MRQRDGIIAYDVTSGVHFVRCARVFCMEAEEVRQGQVNYAIRITCAIRCMAIVFTTVPRDFCLSDRLDG